MPRRKTKRNLKKRGGVVSPRKRASKDRPDDSLGTRDHIRKKSRSSYDTSAVTAYGRNEQAEAVAEAAAAMAAPAKAAQRHVTINKPGPGHRTRNYRRRPSRTSSDSIPSLTSPPSPLLALSAANPETRVVAKANEELDLEKIRQTRLLQYLNDIGEQNNEKANELGMRHITVKPTNNDNPSIRVAIDEEQNKGVRYDDELRARMAARKETEYQSRFNNTLRRLSLIHI